MLKIALFPPFSHPKLKSPQKGVSIVIFWPCFVTKNSKISLSILHSQTRIVFLYLVFLLNNSKLLYCSHKLLLSSVIFSTKALSFHNLTLSTSRLTSYTLYQQNVVSYFNDNFQWLCLQKTKSFCCHFLLNN